MNGFIKSRRTVPSILALVTWILMPGTAQALAAGKAPSRPPASIDTRPLTERLRGPVAGAHQGGVFQDNIANTIAVFSEAFREGATVMETDLRLTEDGHAVAYHDEILESWTNCRGKIRQHTLEEISRCTLGTEERRPPPAPEHAIPSFRALLDWSKGKAILNAEFKELEVIPAALAALREKNAYEWVYFQTKNDPARYELARSIDPNVYLLFAADTVEQLEWALSLNDPKLLVIEIDKALRKPEHISAIHRAGKLVSENAWHYRRDHEYFGGGCSRAFAVGVDIAISNRPATCAKQRDQFLARPTAEN